MAIGTYILEQALRQLQLPEASLRQFAIVHELGNVEGSGFPRELFQLSAPVIIRGLLNFATFQMRRNWTYPVWVHRQLDPDDPSYTARSQNPIFVNTTHRNWTLLGSPTGEHEAIVDRHGLATPLPREWSLDVWLCSGTDVYLPSRSLPPRQDFDTAAPILRTSHDALGFSLIQEHFVGTTNHHVDILFCKVTVLNVSQHRRRATLAISVRPFNPEGVAPIERIALDGKRFIAVNGLLGLVLAEIPNSVVFSSGERGDLAEHLRHGHGPEAALRSDPAFQCDASCSVGLAHASALFDLELGPGEGRSVHASIALGTERALRSVSARHTWRVSYDHRRQRHLTTWSKELEAGARIRLPHADLQKILDANRLALLQLHDKDLITPGPFLYHHMWYRDAAIMCRALDVLGFHGRVRTVINGFRRGQTSKGYYQGPDGEWDSNGAVLWLVGRHFELTRSHLWLRSMYPSLRRAATWIKTRRQHSRRTSSTHAGLMPRGLSAEHLGTVDQYYWDSFYSLAGLRKVPLLAGECRRPAEARQWEAEARSFAEDVRSSLLEVEGRIGMALVPATPFRDFDESAIGSVSALYPLGIQDIAAPAFLATLRMLEDRYVHDRGFLHPFIHSGYNPYLTLQIAHAELWLGNVDRAWRIAGSILRQGTTPYSLPEAIHPRTGGGSMGDGHHGWAAAEIVLFLRDCVLDDRGEDLKLFDGAGPLLEEFGPTITLEGMPTRFGMIDARIKAETTGGWRFEFEPRFFTTHAPRSVSVQLPFPLRRVIPSSPSHLRSHETNERTTVVVFSPDVRSALFLR